jgi:very-short-patch-repair endonuclease
MDAQLGRMLTERRGAASALELLRQGAERRHLSSALAEGSLVRVRRDAYVSAHALIGATAEQAYALRARAILAGRPAGGALSHHAALAVRGLPLFGVDLRRVDLVGEVPKTTLAGTARIRPVGDLSIVLVGDARCVTVADALVQVALASGVVPAVVAADQALHGGLCTADELVAAADRRKHARAHRRVSALVTKVDSASESVGESRARMVLVAAGLAVRSQVLICTDVGEAVGRVDLLVGERVVVEFDGAVKYADDPVGNTLFQEKKREDRLRELGYVVVRVTWADLANPARLLARVRAAQAAATLTGALGPVG